MKEFEMKDLPIAELVNIGLFENGKVKLPEEDLKQLLSGNLTGVQELKGLKIKGKEEDVKAKIRMIERDGNIKLVYYPLKNSIRMHDDLLSPEEKKELYEGKVKIKELRAKGTILDYGEAPYNNIEGNSKSFFIKLQRENGSEKTMWGKELKSALAVSNKDVGDKIQISYTGKEDVEIEPKQILEIGNKKIAFDNPLELQGYLSRNIKGTADVEINGNPLRLDKTDVDNYDWFVGKYSEVFNSTTKAQRNSWEIEPYYTVKETLEKINSKNKGGNEEYTENEGAGGNENEVDNEREEGKEVLLEYDPETESFIGVDVEDIPQIESVNGMRLTKEQMREFREGRNVILPDDTTLSYSPVKGLKSNRSALVLSLLLDGGISFVMFHVIRAAMKKVKLQSREQEQYKAGYLKALENQKIILLDKLQGDPLSKQIRKELSLVNNEIKRYSTSVDLNKIDNIPYANRVFIEKAIEAGALNKLVTDILEGKEIDFDKIKDQLELIPDVIDGIELSNIDKIMLLTDKGLIVAEGVEFKIDETGALKRNLEGIEDYVGKENIAVLEKVENNLVPNVEEIENITLVNKQLNYIGFTDENLQKEIEDKIKEKQNFSTTFNLEKEGVNYAFSLDFKEKDGKMNWANYSVTNTETNRTQNFAPNKLWSMEQAILLISGKEVLGRKDDDEVSVKLNFDSKNEEGYALEITTGRKQEVGVKQGEENVPVQAVNEQEVGVKQGEENVPVQAVNEQEVGVKQGEENVPVQAVNEQEETRGRKM